jgi:hypothetical protein
MRQSRPYGTERIRRIPSWYFNPNFQRFRELYAESHSLQLFVGSGLSIGAGYPSWHGLLREICVKANEYLISLPTQSQSNFNALLKDRRYGEAGDILLDSFGDRKQAWREVLNTIFADKRRTTAGDVALKALVSLHWSRILTTNYDTLIETTVRSTGKQNVDIFHSDIQGYEKCQHQKQQFIFKLHGDIADPNSKIILTQKQYDKLYGKDNAGVAEGHSSRKVTVFREVLETLLSTDSLTLMVGYGHEDPYVKGLFEGLEQRRAGNRVFAVVPISDRDKVMEFQEKHSSTARETGIYFIPYDKQGTNSRVELNEFLQYFDDPNGFDKEFLAREAIRRPTVVLINTGGTVSSLRKERNEGVQVGLPKESDRFEEKINRDTQEIIGRFQSIYDRGAHFDFDIKWEFIEQGILSENATSDHWNNLLAILDDVIYKYIHGPLLVGNDLEIKDERLNKIYTHDREIFEGRNPGKKYTVSQFVGDFKGRFIEGIVILHGTDTLAYSAAALALGTAHLPCAIVITGSNLPPGESLLERKSRFYWKSDAWNNIVTSIYFLITLGHRYTEVFVCFGQTIHNGVNLRKINSDVLPIKPSVLESQRLEPFSFRNISPHQQYMFRIIDGIFCNNYYPIGDHHHEEICGDLNALRHARMEPFSRQSSEDMIFRGFYPCVIQIRAAPMFPFLDARSLISRSPVPVRIVLLEGYESGTYPSAIDHPFRHFLEGLLQEGIPIALVSRHGILGSQAEYEIDFDIPILRLYGIISETAAPLLSLVVGGIEEMIWNLDNRRLSPRDRLEERTKIVEDALRAYLVGRKNINTIGLGPITNAREMMIHNAMQKSSYHRNLASAFSLSYRDQRVDKELSLHSPTEEPASSTDNLEVILPRFQFLNQLNFIVKPFENVGSAPDGFYVLSDIGFQWSFKEFQFLIKPDEKRVLRTPYRDRSSEERQRTEAVCRTLLERAQRLLRRRGLASALIEGFAIKLPTLLADAGESAIPPIRESFSFIATLHRTETRDTDERFTAKSCSEREIEFFNLLNTGPEVELDHLKHFHDLDRRLSQLRQSTWRDKTGPLEWLIIGLCKGIACGLACYLGFDQYAEGYLATSDAEHLESLRQAVECEILYGDSVTLCLKVTYHGWYPAEFTDSPLEFDTQPYSSYRLE